MGFFSKISLYIKRIAIYFLIISTIGSVFYTIRLSKAKKKKIEFSAIIDTDSGNGISDLFVVARALADPKMEVIALTAAQWNQHPLATGNTVDISQEVNDTLLKLFGKTDIPHLRGAEIMTGLRGKYTYEQSDAAAFIVKKANEMQGDNKLNIIALGPLTNIATAILIDSTIVEKIRLYTSVMLYNTQAKTWNKNEFNARNDLDALDLILNSKDLEMHIMPVSASAAFSPDPSEIAALMRNKGGQWDYLIDTWEERAISDNQVKNWNLALIEAILKPDEIKELSAGTPPENLKRQLDVYYGINETYMKIDFNDVIKTYISENRNR